MIKTNMHAHSTIQIERFPSVAHWEREEAVPVSGFIMEISTNEAR